MYNTLHTYNSYYGPEYTNKQQVKHAADTEDSAGGAASFRDHIVRYIVSSWGRESAACTHNLHTSIHSLHTYTGYRIRRLNYTVIRAAGNLVSRRSLPANIFIILNM